MFWVTEIISWKSWTIQLAGNTIVSFHDLLLEKQILQFVEEKKDIHLIMKIKLHK